ncbi:MAG TPA: lysophospholipid acyltransferase family protein, partial [Candidatus Polarisedimenticolaceae bacterium]|nr:lysophospholipid acyltransferase family protein [Candidatus Polarisedimenticolaceae bacterium]
MLHSLWACAVIGFATLLYGTPAFLGSLLRPGSNITPRLGRRWSRMIVRALGAEIDYVGRERLDPARACLYVANHQSMVDIWALLMVLPESTRFVAKESLFRVPVLGWALRASGFVPVDRTNRTRALRSLELAATRVRSGLSLVLFPEGTRSPDGRLGSFKKGPFHLALDTGVPIVPVAISGSWHVMPPRTLRFRRGRVRVRFLPAVDPRATSAGDAAALRDHVRNAIAS